MRSQVQGYVLLFLVALAAASCSDSDPAPITDDDAAAVAEPCAIEARQVIDRFDLFLEPFSELTPDEFFARPELQGLDDFQADIGEIVLRVVQDPGDGCNEFDFEQKVDEVLRDYSGGGLLNRYLVGAVLNGLEVAPRNVRVGPDDDLLAILPVLGQGSTVQFTAGTFELDATLLVQTDLVLKGAGRSETTLNSSAETAAVAVLDGGNLTMSDMTISHVGPASASVLVGFDASMNLHGVGLTGAVADDEVGGSGLVLTTAAEAGSTGGDSVVSVSASVISDNAAAGIAVTSGLAPTITNTVLAANAECGICYFDAAGGVLQGNTLEGNGVGLQASGTSNPNVADNSFVDSEVAGVLIEDGATLVLSGNRFEGDGVVGVDVQGSARPEVRGNTFGPHAVAISIRGVSQAIVEQNSIEAGEIGVLVSGQAAPTVMNNEVADAAVAGFLNSEQSGGTFIANEVSGLEAGVGVVIEGSASPRYEETVLVGGLVGFVFREEAAGWVTAGAISGQQVGIEIGDQASPDLWANTFDGQSQAGVLFSGESSGQLRRNTFVNQQAIAIQASGRGDPMIEENEVDGGDTGILVTAESSAVLRGNTIENANFAIGVNDRAAPRIDTNTIANAAAGGISFDGDSQGEATANTIIDAGIVGIRIAGSAAPLIEDNMVFALVSPVVQPTDEPEDVEPDTAEPIDPGTLERSGAGLLYVDGAAGAARGNQVFGFVIGVQVTDDAAPELETNYLDGVGLGGVGILYGVNGGGRAERNITANQQLGFQLSGNTAPDLVDNMVENALAAAFLLQGESKASLAGNVCPTGVAGIVILEDAAPDVSENECEISR